MYFHEWRKPVRPDIGEALGSELSNENGSLIMQPPETMVEDNRFHNHIKQFFTAKN